MAKTAKASGGPKLNYPKTILTGFGFMASSIAWAIYDPYITKILNKFLSESALVASWSEKLSNVQFLQAFMASQGESTVTATGAFTLVPLFIGIIMTFDNVFGVIFQPTFGKLSDRCHSRLGKRRPFILIGAPISALLFALIPTMSSISGVMICVILFVFVMSLWRAPVVALMPDLTPPELRSDGNAVINLMGGVGGLIGLVAGSIVAFFYTAFRGAPPQDEFETFPAVFLIGSVVMILGPLVLMLFVKEKDSRLLSTEVLEGNNEADRKAAEKKAREAEKLARKTMKLDKSARKSLVFMLVGLFFLFCGSNAIQTFFSLFAAEILHIQTAGATMLMAIFGACSLIAAIPAGKLGQKFGRKKTIMTGLALFLAAFVVFFVVFLGISGSKGVSMKEYTVLNNAYAELNDEVTDWNTANPDAQFTTEEYIAALAESSDMALRSDVYNVFHSALEAKGFNFERYLTLENELLDGESVSVGTALQNIYEAIKNTTSILDLMIYPVMMLAGVANMMITVNTLPLVLEIGGIDRIGTFTGYYYTATFSAQIASPIVYGCVCILGGGSYISLFYYSPIAFVLAAAAILFVRHGEAIPQALIKEAEAAGD